MCGRARLTFAEDELIQLYTRVVRREREAAGAAGAGNGGGVGVGVGIGSEIPFLGRASYAQRPNACPTHLLPVLSTKNGNGGDKAKTNGLAIETMRWGMKTKSPNVPFLINACSETAAVLPTFSPLLSSPSGRGVLAVEGFYEWKQEGGGGVKKKKKKQPYFVHRTDGKPMLLAVLVKRAQEGRREADDDDDGALPSSSSLSSSPCFVVLTRPPPKSLLWLHDRAPCILPTEEVAREWLLSPNSGGQAGAAAASAAAAVLSRAGKAVEEASSSSSSSSSPSSLSSLSSPSSKDEAPPPPLLSWHPVTPEMGKTSYQRDDASRDIRRGGISSLFGRAAVKKKEASSPAVVGGGVAVKEEKGTAPTTTTPPSKALLASPHSGVKREHDVKTDPSQFAKKKPKTTSTTTTPVLKGGQRSLDSFLSRKAQRTKQEK